MKRWGDSSWYEGEWSDGQKHGKGTYSWIGTAQYTPFSHTTHPRDVARALFRCRACPNTALIRRTTIQRPVEARQEARRRQLPMGKPSRPASSACVWACVLIYVTHDMRRAMVPRTRASGTWACVMAEASCGKSRGPDVFCRSCRVVLNVFGCSSIRIDDGQIHRRLGIRRPVVEGQTTQAGRRRLRDREGEAHLREALRPLLLRARRLLGTKVLLPPPLGGCVVKSWAVLNLSPFEPPGIEQTSTRGQPSGVWRWRRPSGGERKSKSTAPRFVRVFFFFFFFALCSAFTFPLLTLSRRSLARTHHLRSRSASNTTECAGVCRPAVCILFFSAHQRWTLRHDDDDRSR